MGLSFTIIVPVYNTAQYLHRCIDSILSQSFTDFEVLLVDDGSTDGSGAICDSYAEKDGRIQVFHKENGGVSSARNMGLDNAYGEWLLFVDSDDFLCDDTCLNALAKTIDSRPDCELVYFAGKVIGLGGEWSYTLCPKVYEYAYQCLEENCLVPKAIVFGSVFVQCFKKTVIKNNYIRFDDAISYAEDRLFVCTYYLVARITVVLPNVLYAYFMNEGSLMHDEKKKARLDADQLKSVMLIESQMLKKKRSLPHLKKYIHGLYIQSSRSLYRKEIDWRFLFRNASTLKLKIKDLLLFCGINCY